MTRFAVAAAVAATEPFPTATILVVDDEDLIRWSLSERLRTEGCTVVEAEDGRRALERVDEHVDLAVLDYRLPDTDGLTLLRRLKARYPRLLAMFLTAYATPETAMEAVDAGAFNLGQKALRPRRDCSDGPRRARSVGSPRPFRPFNFVEEPPAASHGQSCQPKTTTESRHHRSATPAGGARLPVRGQCPPASS